MPAHSQRFPWSSHYGHYNFFEERLATHNKVASLTAQGGGLYLLQRAQGDTLRVFICECYAFGIAEYMESVAQLGAIDVVIINSAWCSYSPDAKRHCRDSGVGLFTIKEFMSALRSSDYWSYLTDEEEEDFRGRGWL